MRFRRSLFQKENRFYEAGQTRILAIDRALILIDIKLIIQCDDIMRNHVKKKIKAEEPALGVDISIMHPEYARIIANSGFDWACYRVVCLLDHSINGLNAPWAMLSIV